MKHTLILFFLVVFSTLKAQEKNFEFSLEEAVTYAIKHNITLTKSKLTKK